MNKPEIAKSALHELPKVMEAVLRTKDEVLEKWNKLTPVARNECICWVTIYKRQETQEEHIRRMQEDLLKGKRRPCCWPGCPHQNPKTKR